MNTKEVLQAIRENVFNEKELNQISELASTQAKHLAVLRVRTTFKTGDRVVIRRATPKYLNEKVGTVTECSGKSVGVKFDNDQDVRRYGHGAVINVPPACVELV